MMLGSLKWFDSCIWGHDDYKIWNNKRKKVILKVPVAESNRSTLSSFSLKKNFFLNIFYKQSDSPLTYSPPFYSCVLFRTLWLHQGALSWVLAVLAPIEKKDFMTLKKRKRKTMSFRCWSSLCLRVEWSFLFLHFL